MTDNDFKELFKLSKSIEIFKLMQKFEVPEDEQLELFSILMKLKWK